MLILGVIDNFSNFGFTTPLKNRCDQIVTDELSNILMTTRRKRILSETNVDEKRESKILTSERCRTIQSFYSKVRSTC